PERDGHWSEYAGGYSDMLRQRGNDDIRKPQRRPAAKVPVAPRDSRPGKRRLSFHEKHALEALPGEIAALQAKVRANQDLLADPGLYARDRKAFEQASADLVAAQADLSAAEEKWLTLEILREDIERG
ncbi:MAG: ABC transporter ATP-binding protein, partial [Bradyrhizobiaceae bacterium]|nr:ABC transporter ATP-binding protein [Bradyrhizobiaceae bacterium]